MSLIKRLLKITVSVVLLAPTLGVILLGQTAYATAQQITSRKSTISSSKPDDTNVTYAFSFKSAQTNAVKSVSITACTTASGTCTKPTGFLRTGFALSGQPANLGTGTWAVDTTTASGTAATGGNLTDSLLIQNAGNSTLQNTGDTVTMSFTGIHNPTTAQTYYLRIVTYSDSAYTTEIDYGTTAAATVLQIILSGTMPESLVFCVGATITANLYNVPDCTTATTGAVSFNQLFSPADTASATSQMAASTNAGTGYVISVSGATLTNGSYTIAAMAAADFSKHGVSQFGMNLVANTGMTPPAGTVPYTTYGAFGSGVSLAANTTNYKGRAIPSSGYDVADYFRFVSGASIADSADGGAGPSDGQIFTMSYIANVTGSQSAGTYSTTLTYVCTPTF